MLCQVHRAVSHDGRQLAVKVQHVGLRDTCAADTVIVEAFVKGLRWVFPDFNYQWLVDELKESVPKVCVPSIAIELLLLLQTYHGAGTLPSSIAHCMSCPHFTCSIHKQVLGKHSVYHLHRTGGIRLGLNTPLFMVP